MDNTVSREVRLYPGLEALSRGAAEEIVRLAHAAVAERGHFAMVLAGGHTPRPLYHLLAGEYRERIPWPQVHLFWGDERYVPPDHPLSNFRMARETLLDHVPLPPKNIHPMPTAAPSPEDAAEAYETELRTWFNASVPHFDLMLLGLGADGHTASLFPGSAALREQRRAVVAVREPHTGPARLTLTFPVFNNAACIHVLVSGKNKAQALKRALAPAGDPLMCPARGIRPHTGELVWWTDREAASLIFRTERYERTSQRTASMRGEAGQLSLGDDVPNPDIWPSPFESRSTGDDRPGRLRD